jgi:hypothetical protein
VLGLSRRRLIATLAIGASATAAALFAPGQVAQAEIANCVDATEFAPASTDSGGFTTLIVAGATKTATIRIPQGVSEVTVDACGAQGGASGTGDSGGNGGREVGTVSVNTTGGPTTLYVVAGEVGGSGGPPPGSTPGGELGGGDGGAGGGGGGGLSGAFVNSTTTQANALVIAGGGGGGTAGDAPGGPGGPGANSSAFAIQGQDGTGTGAGGGGGGYTGGHAGAAGIPFSDSSEGGTNYANPSRVTAPFAESDRNDGDGAVVVSYYNPAPRFTNPPINQAVPQGTPAAYTVTVTAAPVATFTYSATPTAGISLVDNHNNTATIQVASTAPIGDYVVRVTATNLNGTASQDENISVTDPNANPTTGGNTTGSPGPGITPSGSPSGSPKSSPSSSSSSSGPPQRVALLVSVSPTDITPGTASDVFVHGTANEQVQLLAYSRPEVQFRVVRSGVTGADGSISFRVTPGTNTRVYARYFKVSPNTDSPSAVISVHTALSLSAYRDGVRQYHFQGRNLPRISGQLITLYRLDSTGREIRTATTKTDTSGIWRIDRRFTGSGQFTFVARTSANLNNAAGKSNVRLTIIH